MSLCLSVCQGKGDMVTYWLEGKQGDLRYKTVAPDNPSPAKPGLRDMESERDLLGSIPGSVNGDVLLSPE